MDQEFDTIFEDGSTAQVRERGETDKKKKMRKIILLSFHSRYLGRSVSSMTSVVMEEKRVSGAL